jgi:putative peptidoglycan lipid II flippase
MSKFSISVLILFVGSLLTKILGFLRDVVLTYQYGASTISDVYIIATTIPTVLFSGIGMAVLTCFIPIYSRLKNKEAEERRRFVSNIISFVLLFAFIIVGVYYLFPHEIIKIFAMGFDESTIEKTILISNISIIAVLFIGTWNIMKGLLQVYNKFAYTAFSSLPLNLCIIAGIAFSSANDLTPMGIGFLCGYLFTALWGYVAVRKDIYQYKPYLNFKDENLKALVVMMMPVFISQMVMQINAIVNKTLASTLGPGIVSSLSYANRLTDFLATLFIATIGTVVFPAISKMAADNDYKKIAESYNLALNRMLLFIFPATIGLIVLANPVISILFGRGAFTGENIEITATALICYVIAMPFYCYSYLGARVFFALQNSKTPMVNSVIAIGINIVLSLILVRIWGYVGLAIASTTSMAVSSILLSYLLKRSNQYMYFTDNIINSLKLLCVALLMGGIVFYLYNQLIINVHAFIVLAIAIIVGIIVYFTVIYIFNISSMKDVINNYMERFISLLSRR